MSKFYRFLNSKNLGMRGCLLNFSRYKTMEILLVDNVVFSEYGCSVKLGFWFDYRTSKTDHKGFAIIMNLIFWEIQLNFYDKRHVEEYKNN